MYFLDTTAFLKGVTQKSTFVPLLVSGYGESYCFQVIQYGVQGSIKGRMYKLRGQADQQAKILGRWPKAEEKITMLKDTGQTQS